MVQKGFKMTMMMMTIMMMIIIIIIIDTTIYPHINNNEKSGLSGRPNTLISLKHHHNYGKLSSIIQPGH